MNDLEMYREQLGPVSYTHLASTRRPRPIITVPGADKPPSMRL